MQRGERTLFLLVFLFSMHAAICSTHRKRKNTSCGCFCAQRCPFLHKNNQPYNADTLLEWRMGAYVSAWQPIVCQSRGKGQECTVCCRLEEGQDHLLLEQDFLLREPSHLFHVGLLEFYSQSHASRSRSGVNLLLNDMAGFV